MRYDPQVISDLAEAMYADAAFLLRLYTAVGAIVGAFLFWFIASGQDIVWPFVVFGALLLGVIGYLLGRRSALNIRAAAQVMLAQAQIEFNTRQPTNAHGISGLSQPTAESKRVGTRISDALRR